MSPMKAHKSPEERPGVLLSHDAEAALAQTPYSGRISMLCERISILLLPPTPSSQHVFYFDVTKHALQTTPKSMRERNKFG